MGLDRAPAVRAGLPLGIRLCADALIVIGSLDLLCVVVASLATGLAWIAVLVALSGQAITTIAAGAGLSRGHPWPATSMKIVLGIDVASTIVLAMAPGNAYGLIVPIGLMAGPLVAAVSYLERPVVRSVLRPSWTPQIDCATSRIGRTATAMRWTGGFALFVWGLLAAAVFGASYLQAMANGDVITEVVVTSVLGAYATPCVLFGLFIWRRSQVQGAVPIGFALAVATCIATNATGVFVLLPGSISTALAIGMLEPPRGPAGYSALGSK